MAIYVCQQTMEHYHGTSYTTDPLTRTPHRHTGPAVFTREASEIAQFIDQLKDMIERGRVPETAVAALSVADNVALLRRMVLSRDLANGDLLNVKTSRMRSANTRNQKAALRLDAINLYEHIARSYEVAGKRFNKSTICQEVGEQLNLHPETVARYLRRQNHNNC